jgi:putative flippase GtrA
MAAELSSVTLPRQTVELAGQLARFATVGASNTLVTLASYAILTALGLAAPPVGAVAFVAGGANGYFLNRGWTFGCASRGVGLVARYAAVQGLGAALDALGLAALGLPRMAGEAVVLPCVTLMTFALSRQWVFARR